jgi:addiction module HigA family antidote
MENETPVTRGPAFAPSHPGAMIREDVLPALGMTIKDLAAHLGVSRVALSGLVNEKRGVSVEMARRLGKALGNGARVWLALQMQHDLWHAERRAKVDVEPLRWRERRSAA